MRKLNLEGERNGRARNSGFSAVVRDDTFTVEYVFDMTLLNQNLLIDWVNPPVLK